MYRLTVSSDGSVVYVGTRWVKVLGRQQYKLSDAQLSELQAAFEHANFMQLRDYDRVENTDEIGRMSPIAAAISSSTCATITVTTPLLLR